MPLPASIGTAWVCVVEVEQLVCAACILMHVELPARETEAAQPVCASMGGCESEGMSKCECEGVSVVSEVSMVYEVGSMDVKEEGGPTPPGDSPLQIDWLGVEPAG